jgi:homocysteine S-methyltransferase
MTHILDGAMGTELARAGHDVSDALWSARLLLDAPEAITSIHRAYFDAGADVVTTASYQASVGGFAARGISAAETNALLARSVELARAAERAHHAAAGAGAPPLARHAGHAAHGVASRVPRHTQVAASIGPYGATLADGSEYRGDYGLSESDLFEFHRDRLATLWAAGPDILACETIPSWLEGRAIVRALRVVPDARAWMSFQCRDEAHTAFGDAMTDVARALANEPQVVAIGMNCVPPERVAPLARIIREHTDKPIVAYPNSGEIWDAASRSWRGAPDGRQLVDWADEFEAAGVRWMGGCCRTTPADIAALATRRALL